MENANEYRVETYRSTGEFQDALNSLKDGWNLHSFAPGVVLMVIAVYVRWEKPEAHRVDTLR